MFVKRIQQHRNGAFIWTTTPVFTQHTAFTGGSFRTSSWTLARRSVELFFACSRRVADVWEKTFVYVILAIPAKLPRVKMSAARELGIRRILVALFLWGDRTCSFVLVHVRNWRKKPTSTPGCFFSIVLFSHIPVYPGEQMHWKPQPSSRQVP